MICGAKPALYPLATWRLLKLLRKKVEYQGNAWSKQTGRLNALFVHTNPRHPVAPYTTSPHSLIARSGKL